MFKDVFENSLLASEVFEEPLAMPSRSTIRLTLA
jgi:hypothetical protein